MTHISLFSGAGACDAAFHSLGWDTVAFSEVDEAASSVLRYRFDTENVGDITAHDWTKYKGVDVVAGGSPCQSFSVAGLRKGLEDDRGNLTLAFVRAVDAIQPRFVLWENVPGVLSDNTNAFGCFIAALVGADAPLVPPSECGGRWTNAGMASGPERVAAWRVLDAQYFGVAQRRRRVFVVACPRDGADPSEILFESEGVRRDTPPSREEGAGIAGTLEARASTGGYDPGAHGASSGHLIPEVSRCDTAGYGSRQDYETETMVPYQCHGSNVGPMGSLRAGNGNESGGVPFVAHDYSDGSYREDNVANPLTTGTDPSRSAPIIAFSSKDHGADAGDISPTLRSMSHDRSHVNGGGQVAVAIRDLTGGETQRRRIYDAQGIAPNLSAEEGRGGGAPSVVDGWSVRRLTPRECERLQGYPATEESILFEICFEQPRNRATAEGPSHKSQRRVGNAEKDRSKGRAQYVARSTQPNDPNDSRHALHDVHMHLGGRGLVLRSPQKSQSHVTAVEGLGSSSHRLQKDAGSALRLAGISSFLAQLAPPGKGVSHQSELLSIHRDGSKVFVRMYGSEIMRLAGDVECDTPTISQLTKCITSSPLSTASTDTALITAFFSVLRVITGLIPEKTLQGSSLRLLLTTDFGWTRYGKDESGRVYEISDTQRYRMIGNGWALPVVAWIARRIQEHVEMKRAA